MAAGSVHEPLLPGVHPYLKGELLPGKLACPGHGGCGCSRWLAEGYLVTPAQRLLQAILLDPRAQARNNRGIHVQGRCVVYWMQRAQRTADNPAMDAAVEAANALSLPLAVFFSPRAGYPGATLRAYAFLADGVADIAAGCAKRGAHLVFRPSNPSLLRFCHQVDPAVVVVDENPMRAPQQWRTKAAAALRVALVSVDADAVVPMRLFPKLEYAARTLRPKIHRVLGDFLVAGRDPKVRTPWPHDLKAAGDPVDGAWLLQQLKLDRRVGAVNNFPGGEVAGLAALRSFVRQRLEGYAVQRNKPELDGTSRLSPYLHFGHLGPRAVALAVRDAVADAPSRDAFLEELIVRRELALNFVLHEPAYDRLEGCPAWARTELLGQQNAPRPMVYSAQAIENARTADPLFNAGQQQMVLTGHMHGYVRMYWAKKILEWSVDPAEAFALAVRLNDTYQLDGRDPNGYTGVAWAMGGRHDRPWAPRRPVFGTVRYMSLASTGRKFNLRGYVEKVAALGGNQPPQGSLFPPVEGRAQGRG